MDQKVLVDAGMKQLPSNHEVSFQHQFNQNGMFEDEPLAALIELARDLGPDYYTLGSLNDDGYGDKWQTGILGEMSGHEVLEAIRNGRLWLQLQQLKEVAPEHHELAEQAFRELKQSNPGFSYHKLTSNILISSPSARVLCHLDCAEVILWHIRGRKRVYLYDLTKKEFANEQTIEKVIMRETEEEIPFDPDWDGDAQVYDLEPGQAVNWPHFWPHRVDNLEGLNVSLQTEFYSSKGLRQYGVRFANGVMRRKLGVNAGSTVIEGPIALAKIAAGLVAKKLNLHKATERELVSRFTIDPIRSGAILKLNEPV